MKTRRERGIVGRVLTCSAAGIAVVVLAASPAAAHATLESSTPPNGALLPSGAAPSSVSLKFDSNVAIPKEAVRVLGASGRAVTTSEPRHDPDGSTVKVALPALADGGYVVTWRVVSSDAHVIDGAFTFTVGDPAQALTVGSVGGSGRDALVGLGFGIDRFLAFISVLLFVGGAFFVRVVWPELGDHHTIRTVLRVAWIVAIATAVLAIGWQGVAAAGKTLSSIGDLSLTRDVMETDYGRALAMRVVLLVLLVPFVRRLRRGGPGVVDGIAAILALGVFATFVYSGHAHAGRWVTVAMPVDVVHLAAAAAWLGGLALLAAGLALAPRPAGAALAARRFATLAPIAIALVVLSGLTQSLRQVGSWAPLIDTSYGRLLGVKAILVGVVLLVAVKSRSVVQTRLGGDGVPAGGQAARKNRKAEARDLTVLRNTVAIEVGFAVVVVVLTTLLTNAPPARDEAGRKLWPGAPFATEVQKEGVTFRLAVAPGHTGTNSVVVTPRTAGGQPATLLDMRGAISQPGAGIARINVALQRRPDGAYSGRIDIPIAGLWTLDVFAFKTDVDETVLTATVPVGTANRKGSGGADIETASPVEIAAVVIRHRPALSQLLEAEPAECDATGTARAGCQRMLRDLAAKSVALARELSELNVAHEVESLTHFTIDAAETFAHFTDQYVDAGCAASPAPAATNPECRLGPQTYRAPATDLVKKMAAWDLYAAHSMTRPEAQSRTRGRIQFPAVRTDRGAA